MKEEIPYNQMQHAFEVLEEVDKLRKAEQHCDFTIKVGSETILVNKNILCANSDYFRATFSHDTLEKQTGVVELDDLDPDCVKICADFMYGRKIYIAKEKWENFMQCADRLLFTKLRRFIENFLKSSLSFDTFYVIWRIAKMYGCSDLERECEEFAAKNFELISQLDEFQKSEKQVFLSVLKSDLNRASPINKLKAILNWVKFDATNRKTYSVEILEHLDLSQIPVQYLRFLVERDEFISQSLECSKLVSSAVMDSLSISALDADAYENDVNSILVFDGKSRHLQCWNPEANSWRQMQALHIDLEKDNFSAVVQYDYILVFLSNNKLLRLKHTDSDATWEEMASMNGKHEYWPRVVSDSRYVYAIGACKSIVEKYDTIRNCWDEVGASQAGFGSCSVLLKDKIYCIGGYRNGQADDSVETFCLRTCKWNAVSPLPHKIVWAGASTHLGNIYVIGGHKSKRKSCLTIDCYDSMSDQWASLPPMPMTRTVLPVIRVDDEIFAVGKYGEEGSLIQRYDIKDQKWIQLISPVMKPLWSVGIKIQP